MDCCVFLLGNVVCFEWILAFLTGITSCLFFFWSEWMLACFFFWLDVLFFFVGIIIVLNGLLCLLVGIVVFFLSMDYYVFGPECLFFVALILVFRNCLLTGLWCSASRHYCCFFVFEWSLVFVSVELLCVCWILVCLIGIIVCLN